jgi:hypothetical protein
LCCLFFLYIRKEQGQKDKQRSTKEEFEDTTGLIRIRTKEKNRQHNGQKKKVQKDKQRSTKEELLTLWYLQTLLL